MSLHDFVVYAVPWWIQAAAGAGLIGTGLVFAARLLGMRAALKLAMAAGALLLALAAGRRARQRGWNDRQAKEKEDANRAISVARRARAAADADSGAGRLRDDDGFRRD
ncbi:hypothetical protein [Aquabacter spiritensis]|uniref:Uncharacterized protein n=1 Tax=Aquabacter spiritensis TaxID=933073 RepID=A0A4V2UYI7_9HYPH|nr:hypothetical protein [Aquabacter spiritensis]TCT07608.1 hypothetical protein EDC64_101127 [Aquabacter spiritensis]